MLIFSNNTKPRKGFLPKGQSRKLVVPTYHLPRNTRNRGNFGWKIKWFMALCLGSFRSYGLCLWQCNNYSVLVCSADFDILHSGSFSHHVKFHILCLCTRFPLGWFVEPPPKFSYPTWIPKSKLSPWISQNMVLTGNPDNMCYKLTSDSASIASSAALKQTEKQTLKKHTGSFMV